MPDFKQAATIAGTALLGGSGASGRAMATSLLNNRMSLAAEQQKVDREMEQLRQEQKTAAAKRTWDLYVKAKSDPKAWEAITKSGDADKLTAIGSAAGQILGLPGDATNFVTTGTVDKETFEPVLDAQGRPVAQESSTGKVIAHPLAPDKPTDRFEPVYEDGKIVGQRNMTTRQVISDPRAPKAEGVSKRVTAVLPDGRGGTKEVPAIHTSNGHLIDTVTGARMPSATIAPSKEETGAPGSFLTSGAASKRKVAWQAARDNHNFLSKRVDRSIELLQKPGAARGALATIYGVAASFVDQYRQATGGSAIDGAKVAADFLSTDPNRLSAANRAALINGKLDANLVTLTFMLAQVNNPDGKISDQDVREAEKMAKSDQGSIPVMVSALQEVKLISEDRVDALRSGLEEDGLMDKQKLKAIPDMTTEEQKEELRRLKAENRGR